MHNSERKMTDRADIEPIQSNTTILEQLRTLSINDEVDERRKYCRNATFVIGRMALAGQITVFYAGPNTGKTLLVLKLIAESVAAGTAGDHVYHINLDDTYEGQIEKADLGKHHGFDVIVPEKLPNPRENFAKIVDLLIKEKLAGKAVFILDTIKKFVDTMDKRASSEFMTVCRKFTSSGGTIIALAHINKNKNGENRGVPAGTSDVLDDCDCAYVLEITDEKKVSKGTKITVEFTQEKALGPSVNEAVYSYIKNEDSDYEAMFYSERQLDGNEADKLRSERAIEHEINQSSDLIQEIISVLKVSGSMNQNELVQKVMSTGDFPRRKVQGCLKRWACSVEDGGKWSVKKGDNNSILYQLCE